MGGPKRLIAGRFMERVRVVVIFIGLLPVVLFAQTPHFGRMAVPPAAPTQTGEGYRPVSVTPPPPAREFRGAWLATVANKDWPSKPGLSVAEQKAELVALLDRAVQLKLNAIIFQVRPSCDAMYASTLDPWSEYLTGTMGNAPVPFYDPLAFAVQEAHRRGLELHAWFNPFRALHPQTKSPVAPTHIARTHPELIRHYGEQIWLDPGEPYVRQYVLRVVMDVVKRYDVDGVQFDDYFYPYPEKDAAGRQLEFPDAPTWMRYGAGDGYANRDDWRRANINRFVESVSKSIKAMKPWVKFGISPFGIWRPMNPPQIRGLDAYATLYADSRLWLMNGWVDYLAPQLYWAADLREQSFPMLLNWWAQQNVKGRHLWPGLEASNVGSKWEPGEIGRQIKLTRSQPGARGNIFYHLRSITDNPALANVVRAEYQQTALVPASPWLDSVPPDRPKLTVEEDNRSGVRVEWAVTGEAARWWVLQSRVNGIWTTEILPPGQTMRTFENFKPDFVAVSAVDRVGNEGLPAAATRVQPTPPAKWP